MQWCIKLDNPGAAPTGETILRGVFLVESPAGSRNELRAQI
jgi:hypothetical protein